MNPSLPADWPGFELSLRYGKSTWQIKVERSATADRGEKTILLDDDGKVHQVIVQASNRRPACADREAGRTAHDNDAVSARLVQNLLH